MSIFHFLVPTSSSGPAELQSYVQEITRFDSSKSRDLVKFGAIYVNKERQTDPHYLCRVGDYLRVHANPKQFPLQVPQVIADHEDFLVIDKPSGLPTHPTVDNLFQNALTLTQSSLKQTLFLTHRLDVGTSGCLLFAKNPLAQTHFNQLLMEQKVKKYYRADVEGLFSASLFLKHWMKPTNRAPRELSDEAYDNYQLCELEIKDVQKVSQEQSRLIVYPHTGRTHQIRAQLAQVGFPIVGDYMYGAKTPYSGGEFALRAVHLQFSWKQKDLVFSGAGRESF